MTSGHTASGRFFSTIFLVAVLGAGSSPWDTKALADEGKVSRLVGGFSSDQRRLYDHGLQHIQHAHQRPGQYTIRQVISNERSRENHRNALRHNNPTAAPRAQAPLESRSGGSQTWVIFLLLALFVAGFGIKQLARIARNLPAQPQDAFESLPLNPISVSGIPLHAGETFYWAGDATWSEFHNESQYTGGYGGMSVHVARGLTLRSGGSRGRSKRIPVFESVPGKGYVSNRRVVFIGATLSREFAMGSWEHATAYRDGIHIDVKNKPPVEFASHDEMMPRIFDRVANNEIAGKTVPVTLPADEVQPPASAANDDATPIVNPRASGLVNAREISNEPDRREVLVTVNDMNHWKGLSEESKLATISESRKATAATRPGRDVTYIQFVDPEGALLGEASPTACHLI